MMPIGVRNVKPLLIIFSLSFLWTLPWPMESVKEATMGTMSASTYEEAKFQLSSPISCSGVLAPTCAVESTLVIEFVSIACIKPPLSTTMYMYDPCTDSTEVTRSQLVGFLHITLCNGLVCPMKEKSCVTGWSAPTAMASMSQVDAKYNYIMYKCVNCILCKC